MNRAYPALLAIAALSLPMPPANAGTRSVALSICGDGNRTTRIPRNPVPQPADDHQCCGKACHAGCERKRKGEDTNQDDEPEE